MLSGLFKKTLKPSFFTNNLRCFSQLKDIDSNYYTVLRRDTNQVEGLAQFAHDFLKGNLGSGPSTSALERTELFHTDSVLCGLSALSLQTNAPTVLQHEAKEYDMENGAQLLGTNVRVKPEKAVVANSSAVREWDSNGTVFGYNSKLGNEFKAGEFGHNDYYPSVLAASQIRGYDGKYTLKAMLLHDEIRGRLAEVFSLKSYKIDHVVHGAIATAIVYGTMMGCNISQIESAVGMVLAHYIPFRAIRAGHQLSDSKGASAAISSEVAILSVHRALKGFIGPADIFRNPQCIFRLNEPTLSHEESPFDIVLTHSGSDFSVMGMHFKLGLYEHQSAGAIQALIDALRQSPNIVSSVDNINSVSITIYEPAFSIIGDPAKRTPDTRQSADHSMVYIIGSILRKALDVGPDRLKQLNGDNDKYFKELMLLPHDYGPNHLYNEKTRQLMNKIQFKHGGKEYDDKYPEGIPTTLSISCKDNNNYSSDLVMFPSGHARNNSCDLKDILKHKFYQLAKITLNDEKLTNSEFDNILNKLENLNNKSVSDINDLYNIPFKISSWEKKIL